MCIAEQKRRDEGEKQALKTMTPFVRFYRRNEADKLLLYCSNRIVVAKRHKTVYYVAPPATAVCVCNTAIILRPNAHAHAANSIEMNLIVSLLQTGKTGQNHMITRTTIKKKAFDNLKPTLPRYPASEHKNNRFPSNQSPVTNQQQQQRQCNNNQFSKHTTQRNITLRL